MVTASGTVVIVDDDPAVRKALHRLIQAAGYRVESLADAAAYLARPPTPPPACIVLDIRMPGMNGLELQATIGGTSRALPIVFITGHGGEEMRSQALASGAVDVLFKPLEETTLITAIERALERSRGTGGGPGSGSTRRNALLQDHGQDSGHSQDGHAGREQAGEANGGPVRTHGRGLR